MIILTIIIIADIHWMLMCVMYYGKLFPWITLFNAHNSPKDYVLKLASFYGETELRYIEMK